MAVAIINVTSVMLKAEKVNVVLAGIAKNTMGEIKQKSKAAIPSRSTFEYLPAKKPIITLNRTDIVLKKTILKTAIKNQRLPLYILLFGF